MSICIVSADPNVLQSMREGLAAARTQLILEVLSSGADAITRLYNPNAIMPKILFVDVSTTPDAGRLIDFVRASGPTRTLPVVAITDDLTSSAVTLAGINGATHFLRKPIAAAEIIRIIGTLGLAKDSISTTKPTGSPRARP